MANETPVLDLTKLSPKELALLQKAFAQFQSQGTAAPVVDFSKNDVHYVCWNPNGPHAHTQRDMDEADRLRSGDDVGKCPEQDCSYPVGHAPVAINNKVIDLRHQAALRAGDPDILKLYHGGDDDINTDDAPFERVPAGGN